jgi:2,3-bisphosphoglycerate-independent phosphoglycerate mutase
MLWTVTSAGNVLASPDEAMVFGIGEHVADAADAIQRSYNADITDEFIKPTVIVNTDGHPVAVIKANDAIISFNFQS